MPKSFNERQRESLIERATRGMGRAADLFGLYRTFRNTTKPVNPQELEKFIRQRGMSTRSLSDIYNQMIMLSYERDRLYRDYEALMQDSTVASALELFTDDAVPFNRERGVSVWVEAADQNLADRLNRRLREINIEDSIWDWTFTTAAYGDFAPRLQAEPGRGIISIDDTRHPIDFERVDINGRLVAFRDMTMPEGMQYVTPFDYVHFRVLAAYQRKRFGETGQMRNPYLIKQGGHVYSLTSKYGVSMMANSRRPWIQMTAVENAMILNRMARHPRTVYFLTLDEASPKTAREWVELFEEKLYNNTAVDFNEGELGNYPEDLSVGEDVVIPTTPNATLNAQELGQRFEVRGIEDVKYLRDKFFGSLKVPKPFLGLEDSLPGGIGENSLLYISMRYARSVKRLNRGVTDGVKRLLMIDHLLRHPDQVLAPDAFRVVTDISSTAEEIQRRNAYESMTNTIQSITRILGDLGEKHRLDSKELARFALQEAFPELPFEKLWVENDEEAKEKALDKMGSSLMPPPEGAEAPGEGGGSGNGNGEGPPKPPSDGFLETVSDNKLRKMAQTAQGNEDRAVIGREIQRRFLTESARRERNPKYKPPTDPDLEVITHEIQRWNRTIRKGRSKGVRIQSARLSPETKDNAKRLNEEQTKAARIHDQRVRAAQRERMVQNTMRESGMTREDAERVVEIANRCTSGGRVVLENLSPEERTQVEAIYRKYEGEGR